MEEGAGSFYVRCYACGYNDGDRGPVAPTGPDLKCSACNSDFVEIVQIQEEYRRPQHNPFEHMLRGIVGEGGRGGARGQPPPPGHPHHDHHHYVDLNALLAGGGGRQVSLDDFVEAMFNGRAPPAGDAAPGAPGVPPPPNPHNPPQGAGEEGGRAHPNIFRRLIDMATRPQPGDGDGAQPAGRNFTFEFVIQGENGEDARMTLDELLGRARETNRVPEEHIRRLPNAVVTEKHVANETQCTTCMDHFTEVGAPVCELTCGHIFHLGCIVPWLQRSKTCPVCRSPIDSASWGLRDDIDLD